MIHIRRIKWRKVFRILSISFFVGVTASWAADTTESAPNSPDSIPAKQNILFEVTYINFAAGYQCKGVYIDREGKVYSFDYDVQRRRLPDEQYKDNPDGYYTEKELLENFSPQRKLIDTLDKKLVREKFELIKDAVKGEISKAGNTAFDAGGRSCLAYLYDEKKGKYLQVFLYTEGDWTKENLSDAARELTNWLCAIGGCFRRETYKEKGIIKP